MVAVQAVMHCPQVIEAEQVAVEIAGRARKRRPAQESLRAEVEPMAVLGRVVLVQVQSAEVEIVAAMEAAAQAGVRQIAEDRILRHRLRLLRVRHRLHQAVVTVAEEIQAAGTADRYC